MHNQGLPGYVQPPAADWMNLTRERVNRLNTAEDGVAISVMNGQARRPHMDFNAYLRSPSSVQPSPIVGPSYPVSNRDVRVESTHIQNQYLHGMDIVSDHVEDTYDARVARTSTLLRHQGHNASMPMTPVMTSRGSHFAGNSRGSRRSLNNDESHGLPQYLPPPSQEIIAEQGRDLPHLPTNLRVREQTDILVCVNTCISRCAFDFVAKYRFPIPMDSRMRPVELPQDREWNEWVQLLKALATKRRIPARLLYNGQIKQLITILENSLEIRHAAMHQSRPSKDDRNILQLVSAGIQVAKILKDACAMKDLDDLYADTEKTIQERKLSVRSRNDRYIANHSLA